MKYNIIVNDNDCYYEKEININDFDKKNVKAILDSEVNYMRKDFYKEHKSQANNIVIRKKY